MTVKITQDDKELDIYESRVLNKQYSDDAWQLTKYTSELRKNSDNSFFAFIDFTASGEGTIRECEHCLQYEIHSKLGPKILNKGEPVPPDHDNWLQCQQCGNVYPIYQTYPESEIKDSLETVSNPFENNESIFLSVGKRKLNDRRNKYQNEDPDITAELGKGNEVRFH